MCKQKVFTEYKKISSEKIESLEEDLENLGRKVDEVKSIMNTEIREGVKQQMFLFKQKQNLSKDKDS